MKLKLLFFIGILSVLFNTVKGQNSAPSFQVAPSNRVVCPGYVAANTQFQVTDANTPAALLVTTASAVGGQNVTFNFSQDPTGILRSIDVIPVGPIVPGIVTVTIQLSDVGVPFPNLSTPAVFTVSFVDTTDPVISTTLPLPNITENISAGAGCKFTVPDYTSLISATDDCGGVVITQSPAPGAELSVVHNDVVTITITATDDYGNDVSTSFDITLKDVTNPDISTVADFDVNINAADCDFTIPDYTSLVTTSDNCGTVTVTQSPLLGAVFSNHNTTQLITLTADDGNGNTNDTTFTITLKDVTDPVFTSSPTDNNVNVDALDCTFTIPDYVALASATDNCGTATITQSPTIGSIVSGHNTTQLITLTADDGNGNTTDATFTITLKDVTNPTISAVSDFDVNINAADCDFTIPDYTSLVTTSDNCGTVTVTQSPLLGTVLSNHNTTQLITLTADDGNGNTTDETFTITLKDVTKPDISTVADFDVNINAADCDFTMPDYTSLVTTSDNCGTVTVTQSPLLGAVLSNHNTTQVITLTADDGNGNTNDTTFTITLKDVTDPVFTSSPTDNNVNVDALDCTFTIPDYVALASATDNCGTATITQSPTVGSIVSGHNTTQLITLTADDGNGNTTDATFTITLKDVTNPTISAVSDFDVNINVANCDFTIPDYAYLVTTADNCGTVTVSQSPVIGTVLSNHNTTQLITLTADDGNGNTTDETFTITLKDVTLPIITTNGDFDVDNDPGQCGALVVVSATATDNCTSPIAPTGVRDDLAALNAAYPVGTTTITWSVSDSAGNPATTTQTVTVSDVENPVFASLFPDLTVNNDPGLCSYATSQLPVPNVTDNCTPFSGIVTVDPAIIPVSAGPDHLPSIVTWSAIDNYGNTVTASQNVIVQDLELPVMRTKNITKYYDANGQITILPSDIDNGSTDNSGADCFTKFVVPNILYCGDKGDNSVILTGTDLWGNQSYKEATVTAIDNTDPTISAPAAITLNTNMGCTWVGTLVSPTTADNCSVVSVTNDAPAALPLGDTTVTWTVTDASGNKATTTQVVTIIDVEKPIAIAKLGVVVTLDSMGAASITAIDINNGSTDNCGINTIIVSPSSFTCANVGNNVVTMTITDNSNNVSTIDTVVTVQDTTAPTVVTQAFTAQLNAAGTVSILASNINNGSSDSCGIKTITLSPSIFTCANVGVNTVTLTVTDNNNNVSTGTAIVTVVDTVLPVVVTKPFTAQLDVTGNVTITAADVNNGSSDSCGIKTISVSPSSFTCANAGANAVTLTVTDNNDNVSTGTATVTVVDSVLPVVITKPITVQLDASGSATIVASDVDNGSTDNCAIASYTLSKSTFTCSDIGVTTITLKATDTSGNVSLPVNVLVTVQDVTAPTVNTKNITVQLNAAGIASIVPADVNNGSTDACGIASYSLDKTTFNCSNVGANTVTLTIIDINGNSSSTTATVTVQDTVKPIALTRNITVQLNAAGTVSILPSDIDNGSTDNCAIVSYALSKSTFDCSNVGTNTIQLTATDAAGNVSLPVDATVIVQDKVVPTVITKDITVQLNSAGTVTIAAADVNNGSSDICGAVTLAISKSTFTCPNVGANVITLTVTDVNGNINQGFATVTVVDSIIPVITSNGNKTANADLGECSAVVTVSATATDNCTVGSPIGVRSDAKPLAAAYPLGTTTITWNVTDTNGNAAVAVTQTITVTDTQKPVITTNGDKLFVNSDAGQCGALVAVSATATDNCSVGTPTGVRYFNGSLTPDGLPVTAPYAVGTTIIKWNVTDANTNTAVEVSQKVVVKDIQIPVINGTIATINANTDANICAATVSVTAPTASDNCTVGTPIGTRSDNLALNALYPIGTTTITWNVTDINGNVALSTTTTVKVKDATAPTVITKPITITLNVSGVASIVPADVNNGSNDACGIASYSLDRTSFSCSDTGAAKTVTLTIIDIHGNVGSATALVTVTEPIIPIALTRNITVQLNAAGTVSILPSDINNGSTDNCSIASYTLSKSTFNCSNVGQNIITLTATDASGNNSIPVNATVTVQDITAPVVITKSYTAQLDVNGSATVTAANVNNGSTDTCGIATYAISKSNFTCANVGENIVTLTVTDINGNSAQGFATVNVVDSVKPVVVAKDIELALDGISVSIAPEDVFVSATDACGVDVHSYTLSRDTFTIVDVLNSPVTVTLSVTDVNGNVGTDDFLITFPTFPTVANEVITPNGDGTNDTWVIDNITNHPKSIVRVYNAWGSLVFSAVNYQNNWDGKLNGNDVTLPDGGSYYYQIDLEGNGTINNQGWLYITRQ